MNGVFLVDKAGGMTSFDVVNTLKKKFSVSKIGHLGTLDPLATGLLVVFLGNATKMIPYFSDLDKEYHSVMELGKVSDTYDRTGNVRTITSTGSAGSRTRLIEALKTFVGPQWQIQPAFSAIHIHGKRAYELAREGKKVDLGKRQVVINAISLNDYQFPLVDLEVSCSSGTYVRSLVHELGQKLGTGALMNELRRTRVGKFQLSSSRSLDDLGMGDLIKPTTLVEKYLDRQQLPGNEYEYLLKRCQSLFGE